MLFQLEPRPLEFLDAAPIRITESAVLRASPEAVFRAFADAPTWPAWFPLMTRARWTSPETSGLGAIREVSLLGLGSFREAFIAWEPGRRFAFTMTASSSPFASSIVEDFQLAGVDGGTRLDWVMGAAPRLLGKLAKPVVAAIMPRVVREAGRRLEARLRG